MRAEVPTAVPPHPPTESEMAAVLAAREGRRGDNSARALPSAAGVRHAPLALDGAYSYLPARGVKAEPPTVRPYGMTQVNAIDPDGYGLCFQWPTEPDGATG